MNSMGDQEQREIKYINNLQVNVLNKKGNANCERFHYFRHNNETKTRRCP